MPETITIQKIFVNDKSKLGAPFKNGDRMVAITDTQGRKMSTFVRQGHPLTNFQPGQTFEAEITEKNGYLNFSLLGAGASGPQTNGVDYGPLPGGSPVQAPGGQLDRIEKKLDELLQRGAGVVLLDEEEPMAEIPF